MIKPIALMITFFVSSCAMASTEMPGEEVSYMKGVILSRLNGDHVRLSRHDVESEHIYPEDFEARHHSPYLSDARPIQVDIWLSQALNARRAPTTLDLEAEHYGIGERLLFFLKDQNDDGAFRLRHLGLNETVFHELLELPGALEAFNDNTALERPTLYGCIGAQRYDSLVKLLAARPTPLALGIEYRDWVDESSAAYATLRNKDGSFCLAHLGLPSYSLKAFLQMTGVTELLKSNINLTSIRIRNYISEDLWTSLSHFSHLTNLDLAVTSCDTGEMAPLQSLLEAQKPDGSPCLRRLGIPADALNALIHNSSLGHLRVYGTLGHRACEALSHFPLITHLDLSHITCDEQSAKNLISYLQGDHRLISFQRPKINEVTVLARQVFATLSALISSQPSPFEPLGQIQKNLETKGVRLIELLLASQSEETSKEGSI